MSIDVALEKMITENYIRSPMLFHGPKGAGKKEKALAFAKKLLGEKKDHPDLFTFEPEGKSEIHTVSAMKRLIHEADMAPFEAPHKIFIIFDAHRLTDTSSNAILKTLEEHPKHTIIILITDEPHHLIPTIRSRLFSIPFHKKPAPPTTFPEITLENYESLAADIGTDKEKGEALLLSLANHSNDELILKALHGYRHHIKLSTCLEYVLL